MKALRASGIALLACGALGLAWGGFSHAEESHAARLGPFELTLEDTAALTLPVWAGMAGLVAGGLLQTTPLAT